MGIAPETHPAREKTVRYTRMLRNGSGSKMEHEPKGVKAKAKAKEKER
jgi:hypothetical protein